MELGENMCIVYVQQLKINYHFNNIQVWEVKNVSFIQLMLQQ